MLKEFLKEMTVTEVSLQAASQAGTELPEYTADPIVDGETKIGVIEDPWLKALFLAYRKFADNIPEDPISLLKLTLEQIDQLESDLGGLRELVWAELRSALGAYRGSIGIRAGWTVVKIEERPRRFYFPLRGGINLGRGGVPMEILAKAMDLNCGNPKCRICGSDPAPQA
jgi:hypothetical protein